MLQLEGIQLVVEVLYDGVVGPGIRDDVVGWDVVLEGYVGDDCVVDDAAGVVEEAGVGGAEGGERGDGRGGDAFEEGGSGRAGEFVLDPRLAGTFSIELQCS